MHTFNRISIRIIAVVLLVVLTACSQQEQAELPEPFATTELASIPTSTSTQLPTETLAPTAVSFVDGVFYEGKYIRDDYCGRVFDYHQVSEGMLTVAIADNLNETQGMEELAKDVIARYTDLAENSSAPMNQPLTVYVISDPNQGECYSRGQLVFAAPEELDSRSFTEDLLGAGAGSTEYWVKVGLTSLALGEQSDQEILKNWYQTTDDLDMAGLFYARFLEDWTSAEEIQIARLSAASLVQYALEVEGIQPDELSEQVDNEARTRWLASLGVDKTVTYPYDGLFPGFSYFQDSKCELVILADRMRICLNRQQYTEYFYTPQEIEYFLDLTYNGRESFDQYLLSEAPSIQAIMDNEDLLSISVSEGVGLGKSEGNTIEVNKFSAAYWILHEIVHTYDWNYAFPIEAAWMREGFAQYFGLYLPIVPQPEKHCIYEEINGKLFNDGVALSGDGYSVPSGTSSCYYLNADQLTAAEAWYLSQGGQIEPEDAIDTRLYADAVSFATIYSEGVPGPRSISIGEKYQFKSKVTGYASENLSGMELSYTQAASLLAYLCDTYSIDRVLDVYVNGAEDGLLDGKTYAELKAEWQANLIDKGEGIEIPGQP